MAFRRNIRTSAVLGLAPMLAACATGPAFVEPQAPQAGESVIYLYRTSAIGGAAIKHDVHFAGRAAGRLLNGSYLRFTVPGDQFAELWLGKCRRLSRPLVARPGQTLYVQAQIMPATVEFGGKAYFDFGCVLVQRSEVEALSAITGLRRAD